MRFPRRLSIALLMAVVLVVSFSLAALRSGSALWAGGLYLVAHGIFALSIVGAVCRGASERAWWFGFSLFGFGYLERMLGSVGGTFNGPQRALLEHFRPSGAYTGGYPDYYGMIGHCLLSLIIAIVGGVLAQALFGGSVGASIERDAGPHQVVRPAWARWRRFAAIGLAGLVSVTVTVLVLVAPRSDPALWVGALYLLTWGLLGLAMLGFACGRGQRRMIWLGAALFGLGYMVLNRGPDRFEEFSYVHLVADQFLVALRPWLPPVVSGFPAETAGIATANARIKEAFDQAVPMTFPDAVPLEDVLKYIRTATRAPDGREIAIYVDPIGLQEAEKTMQSPIQMDIEGRPLNLTLPLALRQLGLIYHVRDGLVYITCENTEDRIVEVDYYLLLGHCVLALLAAGLGAWLVPLVADQRARQPSG